MTLLRTILRPVLVPGTRDMLHVGKVPSIRLSSAGCQATSRRGAAVCPAACAP